MGLRRKLIWKNMVLLSTCLTLFAATGGPSWVKNSKTATAERPANPRGSLTSTNGQPFLLMSNSARAGTSRNNPCTGVADCRIVDRTDLDGDGRADQVGLVGHPTDRGTYHVWTRADRPRLRISVNGKLLTYDIQLAETEWYGNIFGGTAPVDSRPGREIIVGYQQGAHSRFYTMLNVSRGRLTTMAGPGVNNYGKGNYGYWGVDSSISSNDGITCLQPGKIRTDDAINEDGAQGRKYETFSQQWKWTGGRWMKNGPESHHHVTFSDGRVPARYAGWHCPTFAN
jgi:hypothetical protein